MCSSSTLLYVITATMLGSTLSYENTVRPSCPASESHCEFAFKLHHILTMMYPNPENGQHDPVKIYPNGTAVRRMRPDCSTFKSMTQEELARSNTMDGTYKVAMAINQQIPGPSIVVYENTLVTVNVTNHLMGEAATLHWHGLHQIGTPWMDGAGQVSQCAIQPGETFTYRFSAFPAGTYWYHSHSGAQRTDGLYGAFIVLPREKKNSSSRKKTGTRSEQPRDATKQGIITDEQEDMEEEFIMTVQDFYPQSSVEVNLMWKWDVGTYAAKGYGDTSPDNCFLTAPGRRGPDGVDTGYVPLASILVNGKGRQFPPAATEPLNPGVPLERFLVKPGKKYRFRMINTGLEFAFRVSIDEHPLHVMATDGIDVAAITVDSVIIAAGERYDFWIQTKQSTDDRGYWIRLQTIGVVNGTLGSGRAVLQYGDYSSEPISNTKTCTPEIPCVVLNCPFKYYPSWFHTKCLPVTALQSTSKEESLANEEISLEVFLHFKYAAFFDPAIPFSSTINGIKHQPPSSPPQIYPPASTVVKCPESCDRIQCVHCTHFLKLDPYATSQIVLIVAGSSDPTVLLAHPVHIHGKHFEVVRVGFPSYDPATGTIQKFSSDIKCLDQYCNSMAWTNASWNNGHVPVDGTRHVRKDTVAVPAGGYVVIRRRSQNPGYWFMHCHMEIHNIDGMSLIIQDGEIADMPALPKNFPKCGNFEMSWEEYAELVYPKNVQSKEGSDYDASSRRDHMIVVSVLSCLCAALTVLCGAMFVQYRNQQNRHGSHLAPTVRYTPLYDSTTITQRHKTKKQTL